MYQFDKLNFSYYGFYTTEEVVASITSCFFSTIICSKWTLELKIMGSLWYGKFLDYELY